MEDKISRCEKCKVPMSSHKGRCENDNYIITKKDVDWAIKTFKQMKLIIEEEDYLYPSNWPTKSRQ